MLLDNQTASILVGRQENGRHETIFVLMRKFFLKIKALVGIKSFTLHLLLGALRWLPLGRRNKVDRVVFKVDRIGDFILSLGCLHAILDQPGQNSVLIVNDTVLTLAETEFPRVSVITVKYNKGSFFSELLPALIKVRFCNLYARQLVCLRYQRIAYHAALLSVVETTWSCGYTVMLAKQPRHGLSYAFNHEPRCEYGHDVRWCRELDRHRAISLAVCGSDDVLPRSLKMGLGQISVVPEVVIAPFGSNPLRDIPSHILEPLITLILKESSAIITILAAPHQKDRLNEIAHLSKARIEFCCGVSLLDYVSMISVAKLIISAESATAHLATLFDRFLLCLVGGGHYGEFAPWSKSDRQVWITRHLSCFHCDWHCIYDVPLCICDIDVNLAKQNTLELLEMCGLGKTDA